jgi:hypothetical protein
VLLLSGLPLFIDHLETGQLSIIKENFKQGLVMKKDKYMNYYV